MAYCFATAESPVLEKPLLIGTKERVAARLVAARIPEAVVNAQRRAARKHAKKKGYTPSRAHVTLLGWNLFSTNVSETIWQPSTVLSVSETIWPPSTVLTVYPIRWQVEVFVQDCKSHED